MRTVLAVEQLEERAVASATLNEAPFAVLPASMLVQAGELQPTSTSLSSFTNSHAVRRELIVLDSTVANADALLADMLASPGAIGQTEYLVARFEGLTSLTTLLEGYRELDAIHLVSHGSPGSLVLGGEHFDAASAWMHAADVQSWGRSLTADGDLLLYGCNAAMGESGEALLAALARLTGADVAASTNATGTGGDWLLESRVGVVESNALAGGALWLGSLGPSPQANDDSYVTLFDTPLTIPAPGLLANDDERGGGSLTATLEQDPDNGVVVLNADGSFTYTPNSGFTGTDIFRYRANNANGASNNGHVFVTVGDGNAPPVTTPDSYTTAEDTPLTVSPGSGPLANDSDPNGDPTFTMSLVDGPANGTLSITPDGGFTYTPNPDFTGTDSFTYMIDDGSGASAVGTVHITVTPSNDAPVAVDDQYTTSVNLIILSLPLSVSAPGVLANDTDADGDALTAELLTGTSHGLLLFNTDGSFTYTALLNFSGTDSFTYRVFDGTTWSAAATVTINVATPNQVPIAANNTYNMFEDSTRVVSAPGVLGNDTDPDGDTLTAVLDSGPSHGVLVFNANGSFTYTPFANYSGTDSFTYHATDGVFDSAPATVTFNIVAENDPPTLNSIADRTVNEDSGPWTVPLSGISAGGGESQALLVTAVSSNTGIVSTPTINYSSPDGTGNLTFALVPDASGTANITVTVRDAGFDGTFHTSDDKLTSRTFKVNVVSINDQPTADDDAFTAGMDIPLTVPSPGVLANDFNAEGFTMTAVLVSSTGNGTLNLLANGSFAYTPNSGFSGVDSFTYRAMDTLGALSGIATATINVLPASDPIVAGEDTYSVNEDGTLSGTTVLVNDYDPDGEPITAVLESGPANGNLTLNADGTFLYTPDANFHGTDSFTYRAMDMELAVSAPASVTITVVPVNDAPTLADDSGTLDEDDALTIDVLTNDSDIDGDTLTITGVTQGSVGTVTFDGTTVHYTPNANVHGSDSFTYTVSDGRGGTATATVTITINPVDDPPTAEPETYTTNEDTTLTVPAASGLLINDNDIDGDPLLAELVADPSHGTLVLNLDGSFTYTPDADFFGTDSFLYQCCDGDLFTSPITVTIIVAPVNDDPTASDDTATAIEDTPLAIDVLANDSDIESNPLSVISVTQGSKGIVTFTAAGVTYTPNADANGSDSFTYTISDGQGGTATATVNVTITPQNDAPVATDDSYSTPEDSTLTVPVGSGLLANDSDIDGDSVTAIPVSGPSHGVLSLNGDGSFSYTPDADYFGPDSFTYKVNDGAADSPVVTVSLTVTPVNDDPTATDDSATVTANTAAVIDVLDKDSDPENEPLAIVSVTQGANGTVATDGTSITFTPNAGFVGTDSFTYTIDDGQGGSATGTVSVIVLPGAITVRGESFEVDDGDVLTVRDGVLGNDSSPHARALTAVLVVGAAHGTVTMSDDGSFTYVPDAGFTGTDTFRYAATDGLAISAEVIVTITVRPAATAPEVVDDGPTPANPTPPIPPIATPRGPVADVDPAGGGTVTDVDRPGVGSDPLTSPTPPITITTPIYFSPFGPGGGGFISAPAAPGGGEVLPAEIKTGPTNTTSAETKGGETTETQPTPPSLPAPLPVSAPAPAASVTPAAAALGDNAFVALDRMKDEIVHSPKVVAYTEAVVVTGVSLTAGYVLLNTRFVFWFLSALLSRSAVKRTFDPLDVIYAWDDSKPATAEDEESLQTMVAR